MTQLVPMKDKLNSVRGLLEKARPQLKMALPAHMSADRLIRITLTSILRNPRLLECTQESLISAVLQSAQLGLPPDDVRGLAYLVPFRNTKKGTTEVQLIPGYLGLLDLARRSGFITSAQMEVVYEWDKFVYEKGLERKLKHEPGKRPVAFKDAAPAQGMTHVYAILRYKDNNYDFEVMTTDEVAYHRDRYSRAKTEGPWVTNLDSMALKTVLWKVLKLAPKTPELAKAIALDELHESGIPQDLDLDIDLDTKGADTEKKGLDKLADTPAKRGMRSSVLIVSHLELF